MRFISILILLTLSLYSLEEEEDTSYSMILKNVRKSFVRKACNSLPKRTSTNILKMSILMNQQIESLSLNNYEAVYLIYYWIGNNIQRDCSGYISKSESAVTTFNQGKSSYVGISSLFSTMVSNLGLKTNTIEGKLKYNSDNTNNGELVENIDHMWNYVLINDEYFLFDPTYGSGRCGHYSYQYDFSDFFFGTNPQYFIRSHFPKESKYQFLKSIISESQFISWPFVGKAFYLNGFKTISPDTNIIEVSKNLQITLTYDNSRNLGKICSQVVYKGGSFQFNESNNCEISNGVFKAVFNGNEKMNYFIMLSGPKDDSTKKAVLIYKVK